ncbi:hypothetical protein VUR80DRAFT_1451 [Thermomyces stellatus]
MFFNIDTVVVIDVGVGAHYLASSSDICRSLAIDPPRTKCRSSLLLSKLLELLRLSENSADKGLVTGEGVSTRRSGSGNVVLDAQTASAQPFKSRNTAKSVAIAGCKVIEVAGYGPAFTH